MKKSVAIIAGVVVIGGGLWLGGSWYTGTRLEAESPAQVAWINAELAKIARSDISIKVSQLSFERGLFDSRARYALTTDEDGQKLTLEFDARYEHGPFPISALSRGQFTPTMVLARGELARTTDVETWFKAVQGQTAPVWAEVVVPYDGEIDFKGGLAGVKFDQSGGEKNGGKLDFSGADLQGSYAHATKHLKGTLKAPGLAIYNEPSDPEPFQFALTGTQVRLDISQGRFGLQMGEVELRADRMAIQQPSKNSSFSVDKLVYGNANSEDERFIKGEVSLRGEALTVNGFALGSQALTFKISQLDGESLKRTMNTLETLSASSANGVIDPEKMQSLFIQSGLALLDANPRVALDALNWKTAKGESALSIHTQLGNPGALNMPPPLLAAQMLKSLDIDLKLHKPMFIDLSASIMQLDQGLNADTANTMATRQYDDMAAQLTQIGFAKKEGETLVSKVQYSDGNIVINGREVPMGELMGLMKFL